MIKTTIALAFISAAGLGVSSANDTKSLDTAHIRHFDLLYKPLIGKRVKVDAVVWHISKAGGEITTPGGQRIYLRDAYRPKNGIATQRLPQGRLVQVIGTLSFEPISPYGDFRVEPRDGITSHLNLSIESFKLIERADRPWPVLCDDAPLPAEDTTSSEQAYQPATAPESKPEGKKDANPESEVRPQ